MALSPKQKFVARCAELGIEVEHTCRSGHHHVHVHAPTAQRFSGYVVDNLSVWDGDDGAPDWTYCLAELEKGLPLETDPDDEEEDYDYPVMDAA